MKQNLVPPSWWKEFKSILKDSMGELPAFLVQQITWQQAMAFWLPATQQEVLGWWEAPHIVSRLGCQDLLLQNDFPGTCDFWEMQKLCNWECLPGSCVMQHGTSREVWHSLCASTVKKL